MGKFVHLHLHTKYSLLDGANRISQLMEHVKKLGMDAVAITDHGNMFGVLDFYGSAKKYGIKPIIGCETYIAGPKGRFDKSERHSYHLTLLAMNETGYKNLLFLVSKAYLEGFYYNPRIDHELLAAHNEGLIGMSGCLGGEIPQTILLHGEAKALELARRYQAVFGDRFYLEIMENGLAEQRVVNDTMIRLSDITGIPLVATNDCHYLEKKDAKAQDILMCIQTGKTFEDTNRLRHESDSFYVRSPEEMQRLFHYRPDAIETSVKIAERCNVEIKFGKMQLPEYQVPAGDDFNSYLAKLAHERMHKRLTKEKDPYDEKVYFDRLERELGIIKQMGFSGYFLIVWDFIDYAKVNGIPVGPGRGSGAGSLVAYAIGITDIDPIKYGLLFERFLNPERVSLPDFDVDFCPTGRDQVIDYVRNKYGKDRVSQIITFSELKARGVIRDVGRVLDIPLQDVDRIAKLVPNTPNITLKDALTEEKRFHEEINKNPKIGELLEVADLLEGLNRHTGIHAAGVVIGNYPLWETAPLYKSPDGEVVTQYEGKDLENIGLIKFDFLGLKTLTLIKNALGIINHKKPEAEKLDITTIPIDDPKVYQIISKGETDGIFQLESSGFKELMKKLKPDAFYDIIAAVALYRPGPLGSGMVDTYIKGKHGEITVQYPHPWLKDVLQETYGVMVYQEQVMQCASIIAGFTLGQADILRRAMGKKKADVMAQQKNIFLEGAAKKGVAKETAEKLFDTMAHFADYGFNKSHSAAYALVSYQTAYLKAHYPVEFMAALLTGDKEDTDKVTKYITKCKAMGIKVLPPDVNVSEMDFTVQGDSIVFGLGAVKNVGAAALESIIQTRDKKGKFSSVYDFTERVDLTKVNKRIIETLIKCGAFDSMPYTRSQKFAIIDKAVGQALSKQKDQQRGQMSLFEVMPAQGENSLLQEKPPEIPEWPRDKMLEYEKELLGFYVTSHPLDPYIDQLQGYGVLATSAVVELGDSPSVKIGGIVQSVKEKFTKKRERMANVMFEDLEGTIELVVFPRSFLECENKLRSGQPLIVDCLVKSEEGRQSIILNHVVTLQEADKATGANVHITMNEDQVTPGKIEQFKALVQQFQGDYPMFFHVVMKGKCQTTLRPRAEYGVNPCSQFLQEARQLFGDEAVSIRK